MTFKNRRARAAQPSGGGVHPSALAIDAGLATLTTFVGRERSVFGKLGLTRVGTAHAPRATKDGRGLATTASATYWAGAAGAKVVCANTSFAVLLSFYLRAPGQTNRYALFERLTGGTGSQNAVLYGYATDQFEFYSPSATGTDPRTGSGITVADSLPHTLIYTYDGATWSGLLDGRVIFSTSRSFAVPLNDATGVSSIGDAAGGNSLDICVLHHATFARGLPLNLARRLSSPNGKWSLFAGGKRRAWAPGAAGGGSTDAAITSATGAATASSMSGASTAATTASAAAGAATASALVGAATKASSISSAAGASTASTLVGAATKAATVSASAGATTAATVAGASTAAAAISAAAGAATASTLAGVTGTGANIGAAAGAATAESMAGAATAAASISAASGAATASDIAGASTAAAAISAAAGAATAATLAGSTVGDASTISPAAGVASAQIIVGASFAAAAIGAAAGAATCSTLTGSDGLIDAAVALARYTITAAPRLTTITAAARRLEINR